MLWSNSSNDENDYNSTIQHEDQSQFSYDKPMEMNEAEQAEENKVIVLGRGGKPKRFRSKYTPDQLQFLEDNYATERYLTRTKRIELSKKLGINERKIKTWFQNRRIKEKKANEDGHKVPLTDAYAEWKAMNSANSSSDGESTQSDTSSVRQEKIKGKPNQGSLIDIREGLMKYQNHSYGGIKSVSESHNVQSQFQMEQLAPEKTVTIPAHLQINQSAENQSMTVEIPKSEPSFSGTDSGASAASSFTDSHIQPFEENFHVEPPMLNMLESVWTHEQSSNNTQQVPISENIYDFNAYTGFEDLLNITPSKELGMTLDDWTFDATLFPL